MGSANHWAVVACALVLIAELAHAATKPTIPAPFHGMWRAADGTCETVPSTGVLVDANEIMFGETGYFVDRVNSASATEADIVASLPPESVTRSTIRLGMRVSGDGKVLTLTGEDSSTTYHRCAESQ